FEDLMIFALNYATVAKRDVPAIPATPAAVALNWIRLDDSTWSLELGEPCEGLLGLNVRAPLPEGVDVTVERGALLDQQSTPAFLAVAGEGLDIGLAALGQGFTGQGELLRVTAAGVEELSPAIDARGHDNASIDVALTATAVDLPTVLALNQNHPNPFNPSTTIKFDLPQRGRVDLKIYALDGSLVRTLVSEALDPGRHDVTWQGRDDSGRQAASGTYFYRLTADGKTLVRKMTLMK
ncbi:MAG TPA: FlgD immunoglobulin-like domain containing protein, partial [Candidatus Krumholzibacteria bacterium]|nr:FlgD immunoglobulin-like domain containing protein [Candidatus Krumholzibacteria bacterium]HRX52729.1 FlgD immunoglobulin-like domain containing protein [Candidatus Krumholzibacteria bacterium]